MASENTLVSKEVHLVQAGLTNLPSNWSVVEIGELLSPDRGISVGVMYPGKHDPFGIPLLKVGDLKGSVINPNPDFRITPEKHHEYRRTAFEGGELLLTLVGGLGQCAIVPPELAGWNAARAIAVIRLKEPKDAKFVRLCLLSSPLQHLMQVWANTTVQATLNLKEIKQLPLPWPPAAEREVIAHILGTLDNKIELNQQINRNLEAIAQAIFKSWFVNFDPVRAKMEGRQPAGMDAATAALFPDSLEGLQVGEIPMGWKLAPLAEVIKVNPRRTLYQGETALYLDMQNMPTHGHRPNTWISRPFGSGTKFMNGDTLLARITPCLENGKTAFVDFLEDGQVGWGSTEYIIFRPKPPLPVEYGYYLARSEELRAYAIQNMTGSSGRQRVPSECFQQYLIVIPQDAIARCFGDLVKPLMATIKTNSEQSHTLATIRDTLLPKLMSGEIPVKEAEKIVEDVA